MTIETHFATYVSWLLYKAKILNSIQVRTINIDSQVRVV